MSPKLKEILKRAEAWPEAEQEELADFAAGIESRHSSVYVISDEEWTDMRDGIEQAERGEFVSDETIEADNERFGI